MSIIKIITNAKTDFHCFAFSVVDVGNTETQYTLARGDDDEDTQISSQVWRPSRHHFPLTAGILPGSC